MGSSIATLFAGTINNKQSAATLSTKKGECVEIVNLNLSNTTETRKGFTPSTTPSIFTDRSDQRYANVNGTWVHTSELGLNAKSGEFKLPMINDPSGLLEFVGGRLYSLVTSGGQSTLYCSDPYDIDTMDERQCVVAVFDSVGMCIGSTDDGIVIGTGSQVIYLQGADPVEGGFNQRTLAYYGAIKNTLCKTTGDKIPSSEMTGRICVLTTDQGVCYVGNGGVFKNASATFSFDYSDNASAFIREQDGQVYYVVSFNNPPQNAFNKETNDVIITDSQ